MTDTTDKRCGTCRYGWYNKDGTVGCGAPFDGNPIWAARKYGGGRVTALAAVLAAGVNAPLDLVAKTAAPEGSNCDNMHPMDGRECAAWKPHPDLGDDTDDWQDMTTLGSEWEIEISPRTNRYRHRPISAARLSRRPFGATDEGGPWRPGRPE